MHTVKLEQRKRTNKMLNAFFESNKALDIVVCCDTLGNAVFWDVPYYTNELDDSLELYVLWDQAGKIDFGGSSFSLSEFPTTTFSTKYNVINKGNRNALGPISFNTGGGFRHFIFFNVFGHSEVPEHVETVNSLLEEFANRKQ